MKAKCTAPSLSILIKLGSIAVHTDEMLSASGHAFDLAVLESLLKDPEITAWVEEMTKLALLPVKRK